MSGMGERIDYDRIASSYDASRTVVPEALEEWRLALTKPLVPPPSSPLLDLGSGTGIWSVVLANWFDINVLGVEPSEGMRRLAASRREHERVLHLGGQAEHLPIKDQACSHAWLSTVIHHIPDLSRCAREVRRVLEPGGRVLIRSAFTGRTSGIPWLQFFPSAQRLSKARWPTVEETLEAFSVAGFEKESLQSVGEISAPNLPDYYERISSRAVSSLTLIADEEFEQGLAKLRRAAQEEPPAPVITRLDLLVLSVNGGSDAERVGARDRRALMKSFDGGIQVIRILRSTTNLERFIRPEKSRIPKGMCSRAV